MPQILLAIVGSRDYTNWIEANAIIENWCQENGQPELVVSGDARGADSLAKRYAKLNSIQFKEFPADWDTYGTRAGPIRNSQIVKACTHVLAFPLKEDPPGTQKTSKKSRGTYDTINKARKAGKNVTVVPI